MAHFIAFNLADFHRRQPNHTTMVQVRFLEARSLDQAKELMTYYMDGPWSVVPKRTFDLGITQPRKELQ